MTARPGTSRLALRWAVIAVIVLTVALALIALKLKDESDRAVVHGGDVGPRNSSAPPIVPPTILKPLSEQGALNQNAAIPLSTEPLEAAVPFRLGNGHDAIISRSAARDCLTAAIYYEAATESEQGQRAVAQVVLNRVRHPAFPSSICSVVYQGSERETGCQFSFTCDGSLARTPTGPGWARASRIATEALEGNVEPSVGMATHYHASYVVPYWAFSLTKIAVVGTHLFYRWNDQWGKRRSFTQAYSGEGSSQASIEPIDVLGPLDPQGIVELTSDLSDKLEGSPEADRVELRLELPAAGPLKADEAPPRLVADEVQGALVIDTDSERN